MPVAPERLDPDQERRLAATLFNATWELLNRPARGRDDDDTMLHLAHASRYHWGQVGEAVHQARGEWQCSRVYAVLGRSEPCLHHAQRVLDLCTENGIGDFDLACAYEALARGHALAGDSATARDYVRKAEVAAAAISDVEDRDVVLSDLATISV